jgi:hypothetical protein
MAKKIPHRANRLLKKNGANYPIVGKVSQKNANVSTPKNVGKKLKQAKTISRLDKKLRNAFIKAAQTHPDLDKLKNKLQYLGLTFKEFLDLVDVKKLLTTKYNPKGTINEIFILNDRVMVRILTERANGSFRTFDVASAQQIQNAIGNVANQVFDLADFKSRRTRLAVNFKTMPDNKLYFDFSMVRYNPDTKSLFIIIPGEIKEPKAAAELSKQFGKFVRRLTNTPEISFQIGTEPITVNSSNVFFLKNNAAGIGRTESTSRRTGKTISERTPVLEIINAKFKFTRPEKNGSKSSQEFIRFLVKMNPELNPDKISAAVLNIKKGVLKNVKP